MKFILSADKNWAIGNKNNLLVRIPNDMKNFRTITTGNVIVMGRKTLESFPQGQPLPNRVNLVLSKDASYQVKGAITLTSIEALFEELKKYPDKEVYVVGGGSIYKQLLPYCDQAIVTKIDEAYEADTYFTNLDELDEWKITEESEEQTYFDICYTFVTYERRSES
ncbi:MAG: dihydrofolate reductase [Lachnospiraceae bacterium]|nr:dihydrofolate reductase [Lachnospiraceae bacterium]